MGSERGLIGDSDPSGSVPRTEEVSAIHWFAASRPTGATAGSPPATGSGSPAEGPRHRRHHVERREPDERAHGPELGHLMREARLEETEGRASARTASGRDPSAT
jgi:hypothetical protein